MIVPSWRTRPAPPESTRPLLHRPRLAAVLAQRWDRRVTALVAGAGFGKSGLLVEALASNRRAPLGHDAWIGCQDEDVRLDRFFEATFTAVRGEPPLDWPVDLDDAVHLLADSVWSHAPVPVSIVIDDLHLLGPGSPGAALLEALVRRLPANAHFVLASRDTPPVALARLLAAGDAVVLTEADLLMTDAELAAFATERGRPDFDLSPTAGWPALAELALHAGTARAPELAGYLVDEVLSRLSAAEAEALAALHTVGSLDIVQLRRVLGDERLNPAALERLPLVDHVDGRLETHSLWGVAASAVAPERLRDIAAAAARVLRDDGLVERAFGLSLAAGDDRAALELLGQLSAASIHSASDFDLAACVEALPTPARDEPAALLAAVLAADHRDWRTSRDRLVAVSQRLAQAGAGDLELIALTRLGILGWQAGDRSVADHLLPRVGLLAGSGDPLAVGVVTLGAALLAELAGDHRTMRAHVDEFTALDVPDPLATMGHRYRAALELQYGEPRRALDLALEREPTAAAWIRVELRVIAMWACWLDGDARAALHWARQLDPASATASAHDFVARSNQALLAAWTGRSQASVAELLVRGSEARAAGLLVPSLVDALAAAVQLVTDGDEARAAQVLSEAFDDPAVDVPRALPAMVRALALVWVLVPGLRDQLSRMPLGRGPAASRSAAQALTEGRGAASTGGAWRSAAFEALRDDALPTRLPPLWVAEIAARYVGGKAAAESMAVAQDALDRIGPLAPPALRHLAQTTTDRAVRAGATAILAGRPPVSEGSFVLRLLGPMVIEHDGAVIDHPDWRRDRVRGLFALIARHGTISRRTAAERLWPDLDAEAAANNLRVTLSYLQRVLEPARTRHEAAYHVRSEGAALRFTGRASWTLDVEEFERLLDTAERDDERGESSVALSGYLAALDWYGGAFLDDIAVDAADELERERLRSRYVRGLVRSGSLLLAVGRVDEAQRLVVAAQSADPWSDQALHLQVECFLALGDRAAALRTHQRASDLADELGLVDSPELHRLRRVLKAR